jgi:ABC-type phosphate transport system permease subunit/ABC-type phosphate transport system auxiliary subunit
MTQPPEQPRPDAAAANRPASSPRARRTPLRAHGTPMVWLMAGSLVICLCMILALVGLIAVRGLSSFWPQPIEQVKLTSGESFLALRVRESDGTDATGPRIFYRTGNRELGQEPFRWVNKSDIASIDFPTNAVMAERREWGIWLGVPRAIITLREPNSSAPPVRIESDSAQVLREFEREHAAAESRLARIESIERGVLAGISERLKRNELEVRAVRLEQARAAERKERTGREAPGLPLPLWIGALLTAVGSIAACATLGRRAKGPLLPSRRAAMLCLGALGVLAALVAILESPWSDPRLDATAIPRAEQVAAKVAEELKQRHEAALAEIISIRDKDQRVRIELLDPAANRIAPKDQGTPDDPMLVSQVVRIVPANQLGFFGKLGVYLDRWREFVFDNPRQANSEGGILPVIFGTVTLTLLLSVAVVPLGVIAALYLREYATQGVITSFVRIAVNNLAGVPSIVYGVFGLGFFCYTVGAFVDGGPAAPMGKPGWWMIGIGAAVCVVAACLLSAATHGRRDGIPKWMRWSIALLWLAAAALAVTMVVSTPYFHGFFSAGLPEQPTFGGRGILWAALTLALLTLPVVIVATEEAIAAVPNSMREGSYGAGASKWQTIRRIVLPQAMPGILTGAILAMARGAGEVAPLMLVGAVKLAPALPVSTEFPFIHLDRSFMHMGFHIYDLGFHARDVDAARPIVWTTTMLLIIIVLLLNFAAIILRARLRAKLQVSSV